MIIFHPEKTKCIHQQLTLCTIKKKYASQFIQLHTLYFD